MQDGGFHGWPWHYAGEKEDPASKGKRPDFKNHLIVPSRSRPGVNLQPIRRRQPDASSRAC
jgi:glucose/arabinose dehydrogenase